MPVREIQHRKDSQLFAQLCSTLLRRGHSVQFRVQGESMRPNILDGDAVLVAPAATCDLRQGDIALVENQDGLRVHRVDSWDPSLTALVTRSDSAIDSDPSASHLFGKVVVLQRNSRSESLTPLQTRLVHPLRAMLRRLRAAAILRLRRFAVLLSGFFALSLVCATFLVSVSQAQTDLQLTQTASATAIAAGSNVTYSEVVTNKGPNAVAAATGSVIVYLQTPPNTTYQSYYSFQTVTGTNDWTCTNPGANNVGPVVCNYGLALASGATATQLTVTFLVNAGTASGTTILSSATVTSDTVTESKPANNTSITSLIVEPTTTSDLSVSMSVAPTPVFVSSNLTYTITVQNLGQAAAPVTTGVLTDTLPTGVTFVSSTATAGWSCSGTTAISCNITAAMAMGSTATITITVTAPSSATTLTNTATATLAGDPNSANNSSTAYTVVQPLACATPGRDGAVTNLTGVVNAYYPPSTTGTLASASTSVVLGAAAAAGVQKAIAAGDLLLIIQMQDASINDTQSSSYGDGLPGDPGSGSTSLGSSGLFEFVTATSAVPVAGGTLTFTGTGPTGGLLNSYSYVVAPSASLGTATAAAWAGNVATFTFPAPLPANLIPNVLLTTTGFAPAGYNLTAPIVTVNIATGVITVALTTNPGAVTTKGTGSVTTGGQQTYQVIRVPQYTSATFLSTAPPAPPAWNGSIGGVLAIDVSSQLTLGGTVTLDALGFRGGGGRILAGGAGALTDYVTLATVATNASKGEGIAGTPRYLAPASITTNTTATDTTGGTGNPPDTLPGGSYARGAPGNAGGGGTDGKPSANSENSGGGAGGNGGAGGQGGYGWDSMAATNSTDGGFGGVAFPASTSALVMGGGGGAGTTNDGSYYTLPSGPGNADCGANCTGIYSSGGAGGGIAIIHAGSVTGTGTISANGQSTLSTENDSTGGGGAGGSILVFANTGGLSSLTAIANGGSGGNAWPAQAPGGFPGERHGPGGGAGGGVIFLSAAPASSSVAGGTNGNTDTVQDSYGATPGQPGIVVTTDVITETPGTQSGAYCASADLSVTNSGLPPVVAPGGTITYTQVVTNSGPLDAVNAIFTETTPVNTTFNSITPPAGWTCPTQPAVGGTGPISCNTTTGIFPVNTSGVTFTVVVTVAPATPSGSQIVDVANITSGTNDPNLANNTAIALTTVGTVGTADLSVTNATSPFSATEITGNNVTLAAVVSNLGPSPSAYTEFLEDIPTGTTFQSLSAPAGWTCFLPVVGSSTGTVSCNTSSSFASGATAPFSLVVNVTAAAGTVISATATTGSTTPDPNFSNNSATATFTVANAGQADLAVTASASPNPVTQANNVTFTETVTNNGPATETNATFTVPLPVNTTLVSFTPPSSGWSCSGTTTFTCNLTTSLAAGASASFSLVVKVNAGVAAGTVISTTSTVSSTVGDPNLSNNSATASTVVGLPTQSSVSITKTASPEPVNQNSTLTYTITVTNGGPAAATGTFTVTDNLPGEVTYIPNSYSTTATGGSCSGTTSVTCSIPNGLPVGTTVVININVTATTFSAASLSTNTATLTTTTTVPNAPTSLGAATVATWTGGVASFTFPTPLPASLATTATLTTTGFTPAGYNVSNLAIQSVDTTTGVVTVNVATNPGTATILGSGSASIPYPLIASSVSTIQAPTAVDISYFHASLQPDGSAILVWHTHEESRNLGFHLYREDISGRHQLDPSLIAGSALLLRGSKPQHAAKTYRWIDRQPSHDAAYWIEDVDINGTRTVHGPVYPEAVTAESSTSAPPSLPSPLLSELQASTRSLSTGSPMRLQAPRPVLPVYPPNVPRLSVADHAAVKISVDHEGWYRVPLSQLFAAGLNHISDPRSLHLYAEGVEQPILLTAGTTPSSALSPVIEFYGTGIDTPFSAARVYWLISDNQWPKRITQLPPAGSGRAAPASFPFAVLREDRFTYFAALLNGESNDNFFGAIITSDPTDQDLVVAHIDPTSPLPVSVDLALQGATDAQEHRVTVQFNGATIGEMDFYGQVLAQQSIPVEASLLHNGSNTVTLTALNGDNDVSVVQSIALHYAHTYAADSDWLRATSSSGSQLHITGFTNPQIRAFDITDPLNISELATKVLLESGSFTAALALTTGGPAVRTILAFADDAISTPVSLAPHAPTFLDDRRVGADVVIISYPDFVPSLAPLVRLRESQGHHVTLVTTDQVFDEFNYGERSPFAIRSFLQEAASVWQRKPQSILLVGGASLDPRDYLGLGYLDFVPTRIIETAAFKTASDDWFTDFTQNGFATIPTGRLPVQTTAEADLVISKIVGYENGSYEGPWNSLGLLVADQNVDSNFTSAATSAAATLPATLQTSEIFADSLDTATARSQILTALNNGALLVDYSGHGAQQQWSFADLFDTNDAAALSNGGRLPIYLLMDCLNGFFQDPSAGSLADALLLAPHGGAVAVWASSGFTQQAPQSSMNQAFLHAFASNPSLPIGRLILQAKAGTTDTDVRRTWILFGDPAMKFQFAPVNARAQMPAPVQHPVTIPVRNRPCVPDSVCRKEKQRQ